MVAALWIAFGQERNARKLRQIAKNEEHARTAHLIGEVIRLTAEIEAFANAPAPSPSPPADRVLHRSSRWVSVSRMSERFTSSLTITWTASPSRWTWP